MGKIALEGLEFFAFHGYHIEEQKTGNRYNVDVVVETDFNLASLEDDLTGTVDYTSLYKIVYAEMQQPSKLLEHIANRISIKILAHFLTVEKVEITVSKFNPPIGGICQRAYVTLIKERA